MPKMQKQEFESMNLNSNRMKTLPMEAAMEEKYDRVVLENDSGLKICLEFPKNVDQGDVIAEEVKSILSNELRDSLRRNVG